MMAAMDQPILGADFLRHHQFDVSHVHNLLVSVNGDVSLPLMSSSLSPSPISKISSTYQEILSKFLEIVGLGFSPGPAKHNVRYHVKTCGLPIYTPALRLDPQKYAAAKAKFKKMEAAGIVQQTNSPRSSALHMVQHLATMWQFSPAQQCNGS